MYVSYVLNVCALRMCCVFCIYELGVCARLCMCICICCAMSCFVGMKRFCMYGMFLCCVRMNGMCVKNVGYAFTIYMLSAYASHALCMYAMYLCMGCMRLMYVMYARVMLRMLGYVGKVMNVRYAL